MSVCRHCGTPDVITDDGPRGCCAPCISALGRIAGNPGRTAPAVIERLLARHLDVVHVTETPDSDGIPVPAWTWTRSWPGVERATR